jgi:hypothetical protein
VGLANVAARCRRGRSPHAAGERSALAPTPIPSLAGRGVLGALVVALSLAGCGTQPTENAVESPAQASHQVAPTQSESPKIPCAAPGGAEFAPVCTVDRTETPNGVILTLRHPDGAFHRLQITRDGRGVIAADGAEPAKVTPLAADRIEVELGGARYRLPATVREPVQ